MTTYYLAVGHWSSLLRFCITVFLIVILAVVSIPFLMNQGVLVNSPFLGGVLFFVLVMLVPFVIVMTLRKIFPSEHVSFKTDAIVSAHMGTFLLEEIQSKKSYKFIGICWTIIKMKHGHRYIFGPFKQFKKEALENYNAFLKTIGE